MSHKLDSFFIKNNKANTFKKNNQGFYEIDPFETFRQITAQICELYADELGEPPVFSSEEASKEDIDELNRFVDDFDNARKLRHHEIIKRMNSVSALIFIKNFDELEIIPATVNIDKSNFGNLKNPTQLSVNAHYDVGFTDDGFQWYRFRNYYLDENNQLVVNYLLYDEQRQLAADQSMLETIFPNTRKMQKQANNTKMFFIPVSVEKTMDGYSVDEMWHHLKPWFMIMWNAFIVKINSSKLKWLISVDATTSRIYVKETQEDLENTIKTTSNSTFGVYQGSSENLQNSFLQLNQNGDQFNDFMLLWDNFLQKIYDRLMLHMMKDRQSGKNNKMGAQTSTESINKFDRLEVEVNYKQRWFRDIFAKVYFRMLNKKYPKDLKVKVNAMTKEDVIPDPNKSNSSFGNYKGTTRSNDAPSITNGE